MLHIGFSHSFRWFFLLLFLLLVLIWLMMVESAPLVGEALTMPL